MTKCNFESHDKEQTKLNSAINENTGVHTLTDERIIKNPLKQYNVEIVKNKQNSNKDLFTTACRKGTKVSMCPIR